MSINGDEWIYYYVKGYYGPQPHETSRTNIVEIEGGLYKKSEPIDNKVIGQQSLQNSPNPFNPTTIISYELTSDSYITLKVFDLLGREITTLAEGFKAAGKYEAVFSVESLGKAEGLTSGTYIYTLNVNGKVFSKKMTLLK